MQEPERLMRFVSGAIQGCGGWVLNRDCSCAGVIRVSFQFKRAICVEIYAVLLASELVLTTESHRRLAELCHCTYSLSSCSQGNPAGVELEVETRTHSATLGLDPSLMHGA